MVDEGLHGVQSAYAGNFVRLRELGKRGEVSLDVYPIVAAWMDRIEDRESYAAAV